MVLIMALTMVIVMKMIMEMGYADLFFDIVHLQVHGVWDLGPLWQLGGAPCYQGLLIEQVPKAHLLPHM